MSGMNFSKEKRKNNNIEVEKKVLQKFINYFNSYHSVVYSMNS